jgi:hypothetical protein
MSSLYHKIVVASVCTALSFTLQANQEAKAATLDFTLISPGFVVNEIFLPPPPYDGNGEVIEGIKIKEFLTGGDSKLFMHKDAYGDSESRAFYEFNIGNLSLAPDTHIKSAFFEVIIENIKGGKYFHVDSLIYVGNGVPDLSDFEVGERLYLHDLEPVAHYPYYRMNLDVKEFVTQRVRNGDAFAGFGFRPSTLTEYSTGTASLNNLAKLTIEAEIVPEPTTIFGSALALGVGGWLKRKRLSHQSKTTPQP